MTETTQSRIEKNVKDNDIVIYMKGTPTFPQCGFSSTVVQIFDYLGAQYTSVNVLDDPEIRQGVKDFNNWPTVPQIFIKGEFVGGCDIMREMFETGELKSLLTDKGISLASG